MKKSILLTVLTAAAISFSFVTDSSCEFEQFTTGTVYTMTNYSAKGKTTSAVTSTVKNVERTANSLKADIHAVMTDDKNKETNSLDYSMSCEDGIFKMDMRSIASAAAPQSKDITLSFEGNSLDYPKSMAAGQTLPDASMTMVATSNGSPVSTTVIKIHDRKVEAVESKTTPAGTWECYKISYIEDISMSMMGMNMPVKPRKAVEWFSYKVGSVRVENYKGDSMEGYSELTALKKP